MFLQDSLDDYACNAIDRCSFDHRVVFNKAPMVYVALLLQYKAANVCGHQLTGY